jgi:hypothetical protein
MSIPDYPQILVRRYPRRPFTMADVTDPATLIANDGGSVPTKDELDALWPSVEPEIEAEQLARRQQGKLLNTAPDALLQLLEVLVDGAIDTRGALPAAVKANLDATLTTRLAVARNRLTQARQ